MSFGSNIDLTAMIAVVFKVGYMFKFTECVRRNLQDQNPEFSVFLLAELLHSTSRHNFLTRSLERHVELLETLPPEFERVGRLTYFKNEHSAQNQY